MELEMVLNELSLQPLAKNKPEARQRMSDLIGTMIAATRAGISRSLRTHQDLRSEVLASDYLLVHWLNDQEVDREARRYFKSLAFHAPYLVDINDHTVRDRVDSSDFFYNGDCAIGLGVAYCLDTLALSIRSDACWHAPHLELTHIYLNSDGGEILSEDVIVAHASHKDHIVTHATWIKERLNLDIQDGADLWRYREQQFPSLQFCDSVGEILQSLHPGNSPFHLITKKLAEFEMAFQQWQEEGGVFDIQLKGSVDSEATLLKYDKERTFSCPDGQTRLFSLHIRITADWRIYYYLEGSTKQLIIGYIGKHLSTVKFS
ncbi:MAG TPA: hypothetical protein VKY19_20690 [Ktedonosporobacter sp.]|jgi:hypothetical protein|nr:hypothetical protein [Ktedonosporobacter sp.]